MFDYDPNSNSLRPGKRRFGHIDVGVNNCSHVWTGKGKRGQWGPGMRQLTPDVGPARADVCFHIQRATIPSKRVIFTLVNTILALSII
jgi:hypothetical protein